MKNFIVTALFVLASSSAFADELDLSNPLTSYIASNITEQAAQYFQDNQKTLSDTVKKFAVTTTNEKKETISSVTPSSFKKLKNAIRRSGEIQMSKENNISQQIEYLVSDTLTTKYITFTDQFPTKKEYVKGIKDYPKEQSISVMNFLMGYVKSDYFADDVSTFNPTYKEAYLKFLNKLIVKVNQQ